MSAAAATVPAAQLVYANVEAHESPSGFRGFQVWLASPELDDALLAEVARQLADFSIPQEVDPATRRARSLQRHAFYRVELEGLSHWVLARTVPTDDKDMYGRMGLFLAHAFVLSDDAFRRVGCNPFALLDAGLPFLANRKEVKERVPDWRGGSLPRVELPVAESTRALEPLRADLVLEMARFLENPQAAPAAIPEEPLEVLRMLRPLFAWLPPSLRGRAGFDTLFTAQSLTGAPYRFVGTFSTDVLGTWSDQRFHQWMRTSAAFVPPLDGTDTCFSRVLAGWLQRSAAPSDCIAEDTYRLLGAIEQGDLAGCVPHTLDEENLRELLETGSVPQRLNRLRQKRIEVDLPARALWPMVRERLPEHFRAETWAGRLRRIAEPLRPERVAGWLRERLENLDLAPPGGEELQQLWDWLQPLPGEDALRCRLMTQRWRGEVAWLRQALVGEARGHGEGWFWGWCHRSLARRYGKADELASELLSVLRADDAEPAALADAELFLELPPAADAAGSPLSERAEIRFQIAYQRGDADAMVQLLDTEGNKPLHVQALRRLERLPFQAIFCCFCLENEYYLGTRVEFTDHQAARAAALAAAVYWHQPYQAVEHWRHAAMHGLPPPIEQRVVIDLTPAAVFERYREREQWDRVTEFLRSRSCTDTIFQNCAESVLGLRVITPLYCPLQAGMAWVGLKLTWAIRDQAPRQNAAFGAVLRAMTPVHELKDWSEVARCSDLMPTDRPRIGWLLMILLNPNMVGKLCVARP